MDNYMRFTMMRNVRPRLKPHAVPHKFACQNRQLPTKVRQLSVKRAKQKEIADCLRESEKTSSSETQQTEQDHLYQYPYSNNVPFATLFLVGTMV